MRTLRLTAAVQALYRVQSVFSPGTVHWFIALEGTREAGQILF
jgi:hypothetical protein